MTIDIEKLRADMAVENKRFAVRAIGVATGCIAAGATLALLVFHLMGKI